MMNGYELKDFIEQALTLLINTRLTDIGRSHALEWMIFTQVDQPPSNGEIVSDRVEYAINIQCAWRIQGPEGIIVASDDLYFAAGNDPFQDFQNFDWAPQGSNRLDERTFIFKKVIEGKLLFVSSIEADTAGGATIHLGEGYIISLFPSYSLDREYWRFFRRHFPGQHFVVTGEGIED